MSAHFQMLDCLYANGVIMCSEAVPELMRAFEIPKYDAKRIYGEWLIAQCSLPQSEVQP
jgi:hypothetical protein